MEREMVLERYRLALALIPDADVAGDLFMRARSEADLRRLAGRWREKQGLGPADGVVELPLLDSFQEEHALHLHRRGRARLRTALGLGVGLIALLAMALALWRWQTAWLPPGYTGPPLATIPLRDGLSVSIYQVEATHGQVEVRWELRGPRAEQVGAGLVPALSVTGIEGPLEQSTERQVVSSRRVFGRTTYEVFMTTDETVRLFDTILPVKRLDTEMVIPLQIASDEYGVMLEELVLAPDSTRLRYRAETPPGGEPAQVGTIRTESEEIRPISAPVRLDQSGLMEVRYDPIPHGVTHLVISLQSPLVLVRDVVYGLPNPQILSEFTRYGDRIQAIYRPNALFPRMGPGRMPVFVDSEGNRYETVENPPQGWDGEVKFSLVVENPPPDVEFTQLIIPESLRSGGLRRITVDLTNI